jgi:[ribosomal protein S5]-alanine N-acetyltransferase
MFNNIINNPILTTPRLTLRQFTIDDAPLIIALNTPEVLQYVHEALPKNLEDAKRIIAEIILPQYELYQLGRFAIHLKNDNSFVGWCGLKYINEKDEIDLGYRFMQNEWGKGFATEAATACVQFGFKKRNIQTIIGRTHVDNIASQKVLHKIGLSFQHDIVEAGTLIKNYAITKADYYSK